MMEVPRRRLDHSLSILEPELQRGHDGCTNAGGHPVVFSLPWGADITSDSRPPNNRPAADAICVDGPPSFNAPISLVRSHANGSAAPGSFSAWEAECDFAEARGAELFRSSPLSTREHPINHSSQAGPSCYSPSVLALPLLPCRAQLDTDTTPTSAVSVPSRSESLPQPPPSVAALLTTQAIGKVVSPVLSRNSPLVPWELPSEIGYFWLGLFKISEVKVSLPFGQKNNSKCLLSLARWKHGEAPPRRRLRCNAPGDFLWNGCLGARTSLRTTIRETTMSG
jgi:hypothetical protein